MPHFEGFKHRWVQALEREQARLRFKAANKGASDADPGLQHTWVENEGFEAEVPDEYFEQLCGVLELKRMQWGSGQAG